MFHLIKLILFPGLLERMMQGHGTNFTQMMYFNNVQTVCVRDALFIGILP